METTAEDSLWDSATRTLEMAVEQQSVVAVFGNGGHESLSLPW